MKYAKIFTLVFSVLLLIQSCAIIDPGNVALVSQFGKVKPDVLLPGYHKIPVFGTSIIRFDTRIINVSQRIDFPTKDGIEVTCEITLLYHFIPDSIKTIYRKFGNTSEASLIVNGLVNSIRQLGVNYTASDIIDVRVELEDALKKKVISIYQPYGFVVDAVMLKDIDLPADIVQTIKDKVNAEQRFLRVTIENDIQSKELEFTLSKQKREAQLEIEKQRMTADFAIEKQQKEATRMLIEASATKQAQDTINASITDKLIRYKSLEISRDWAKSTNTKLIITDGKSQFWMNEPK